MKIDLHVHSRERSACGQAPEEEQIAEAIARGLDAIAFTDHHRLVPLSRLRALNERYAPFRISGGVEITTEGEDVLVFGVRDPRLESLDWRYAELHDFVRARGGFLVLAHPYRFKDHVQADLAAHPPDALEWRSNNIASDTEDMIAALGARHGIPLVCASDAHHTFAVGRHYINLEGAPADERAIFTLIAAGRYSCHHCCPGKNAADLGAAQL